MTMYANGHGHMAKGLGLDESRGSKRSDSSLL